MATGKPKVVGANDRIPLADLNPAPYNPRAISDEALAGLAESIRHGTKLHAGWEARHGYRLDSTITVNKQGNRIVGGHQRVRALRDKLGQDWIHRDDITWIDCEPGGAAEKATRSLGVFSRGIETCSAGCQRRLGVPLRRFAPPAPDSDAILAYQGRRGRGGTNPGACGTTKGGQGYGR